MPRRRQVDPQTGQVEAVVENASPESEYSRGVNIKSDQLKLIPFFSGCPSECLNEFLQDFEEIALISRWNEQERILALKQKLTAAAKVFIRQQVAPIESFPQLISLLREQYTKQQDATKLLQDFLTFTQPPSMSVAEYTNKAINMSYKTFRRGELDPQVEEANRRQMLRAMLLKNLTPEIKRGVIAANPSTIEDIINRATLEERAFEATRASGVSNGAEIPGIFTITTGETETKSNEKVMDLQKKVDDLARKIDSLLEDRQRQRHPPYCNVCRGNHYGRCREPPGRYREDSDRQAGDRGGTARQNYDRRRGQGNYPRDTRRDFFVPNRGLYQEHETHRDREDNRNRNFNQYRDGNRVRRGNEGAPRSMRTQESNERPAVGNPQAQGNDRRG